MKLFFIFSFILSSSFAICQPCGRNLVWVGEASGSGNGAWAQPDHWRDGDVINQTTFYTPRWCDNAYVNTPDGITFNIQISDGLSIGYGSAISGNPVCKSLTIDGNVNLWAVSSQVYVNGIDGGLKLLFGSNLWLSDNSGQRNGTLSISGGVAVGPGETFNAFQMDNYSELFCQDVFFSGEVVINPYSKIHANVFNIGGQTLYVNDQAIIYGNFTQSDGAIATFNGIKIFPYNQVYINGQILNNQNCTIVIDSLLSADNVVIRIASSKTFNGNVISNKTSQSSTIHFQEAMSSTTPLLKPKVEGEFIINAGTAYIDDDYKISKITANPGSVIIVKKTLETD